MYGWGTSLRGPSVATLKRTQPPVWKMTIATDTTLESAGDSWRVPIMSASRDGANHWIQLPARVTRRIDCKVGSRFTENETNHFSTLSS
jgi:hypothetical protein